MTHKKKDGSYIYSDARVVSEAIANVERQDGSSKHLSQNYSLAQVLGKEHLGRVRALGAEPSPTQVFGNAAGQLSSSAEPNEEYKRRIAELTAKLEEEQAKRHSIHKVLVYLVQQQGGNLPVEVITELAFLGVPWSQPRRHRRSRPIATARGRPPSDPAISLAQSRLSAAGRQIHEERKRGSSRCLLMHQIHRSPSPPLFYRHLFSQAANVDEAAEKLRAKEIEVLALVCHVSNDQKRKDLIKKTAQDAAPHLDKGSSVVIISSITGFNPLASMSMYGVTKTTLFGLTKVDMLLELVRREKSAGIKLDVDLDIFMKSVAFGGQETNLVVEYIRKVFIKQIAK
ncbi:hypothetical protein Ahy_A06g028017 [Arachis hypogaea]|uniref:Uncharacterized protein n=1 Tax=Arachis hypogaea TaxID=3818 RepID=A0A445CQ83_ARAHY|nr:hypothetical protein Ahy_A06g028017 [Arachis hypogaea]